MTTIEFEYESVSRPRRSAAAARADFPPAGTDRSASPVDGESSPPQSISRRRRPAVASSARLAALLADRDPADGSIRDADIQRLVEVLP
ncbi:hypothetical protein NDR87_26565 [Nocardia sp. CDC159]|uniref:Uncharacterized protein n=1 Tax=Nocardia pulmonis TaxID=2951408 RepID=A0A9X2J1I7_9NOCA|nr:MULTISPECIES: hypothetical protein [Nocardia]MCM6777056.1 hypothetical protein [Nocardia pulmonis]MCM6789941.1 hypothetical protein [Nocardia sp. CDC159]